MESKVEFIIKEITEEDRCWVNKVITEFWGEAFVVVHQEVFFPENLPGFIANRREGKAVGLVTFQIRGDECEIITLNSWLENVGVGSGLIKAVIDQAQRSSCSRVCVTTTNDNLRAIEFYAKREFRLLEIREDAVARAREIKTSIPQLAADGTPISDEWEFELILSETDKSG